MSTMASISSAPKIINLHRHANPEHRGRATHRFRIHCLPKLSSMFFATSIKVLLSIPPSFLGHTSGQNLPEAKKNVNRLKSMSFWGWQGCATVRASNSWAAGQVGAAGFEPVDPLGLASRQFRASHPLSFSIFVSLLSFLTPITQKTKLKRTGTYLLLVFFRLWRRGELRGRWSSPYLPSIEVLLLNALWK